MVAYCYAAIAALLLMLLVWRQRVCWKLVYQINGIRGVLQQPLLFLLLLLFLDPKSILNATGRLRTYFKRPLAVIIGTRVLLYVDDPETMECVLNAPECMDKSFIQEGFFARRGLLHARGQKWRIRRKQLNPSFSHSIMLSFFDIFNSVGNQLQQQFVAAQLLGEAVSFKNVEDLISRAVLEVSFLTTMGTETNFTQKDTQSIARAYKKLMEISAVKNIKPWLQIDTLFRWLDRENYECGVRCNKLVEQFVNDIVQRKHSEWQKKTHAPAITPPAEMTEDGGKDGANAAESELSALQAQKRIFIEQIFHLADAGDLTLQDIMDESQSMVLVSFETISNSVMIALLCLAMHPDCQRKLRREINETFSADIGQVSNINATQLQQLKYLEMIVNESLRLLPTIPMNVRHVSKDFHLRLPGAPPERFVVVPQDSIVALDTFNMQRDAAQWGSRARQFHPEHFAAEKTERRHAYAFIPFSKGIRWCIGWRYSTFLAKIFLVKLISSFEFHTTTQLESLRFIEGISLKFQHSDSIHFDIRKVNECQSEGSKC